MDQQQEEIKAEEEFAPAIANPWLRTLTADSRAKLRDLLWTRHALTELIGWNAFLAKGNSYQVILCRLES